MGLLGLAAGVALAFMSLVLGLNGWPMSRLWFWQLLAAISTLVGPAVVSWLVHHACTGGVKPARDAKYMRMIPMLGMRA